MLDVVFGENGLIKAKGKKDLKEKVIGCAKLLAVIENEGVKSTPVAVGKFAKYIADKDRFKEASSKCKKEGYED